MSYPKISAGSTAADTLLAQAIDVQDAAEALLLALERALPNERDYYPIGPDSGWRARNAHAQRVLAVQGIRNHFRTLAAHVLTQVEAAA